MSIFEQRTYIKYRTVLGASAASIIDDLNKVHGDSALRKSTVYEWIDRFKHGRDSIEDDPRSGRPVTETTEENIQRVQALIEEDRHLSYSDLEALTSLSHGTIHTILHDHLKLRKIAARWLPHELTAQNQAKRLNFAKACLEKLESNQWRLDQIITGDESWFYHRQIKKSQRNAAWTKEGQEPATVVKRDRFEPKTLFCIFFKSTGPLLVHPLQRGVTMDAPYYKENCLEPTFEFIRTLRPKSGCHGLKLLDDNARPHRTPEVISYIQEQGIQSIDHPPYSPDLAPCDYWLFDYIKQRLPDAEDADTLAKSVTKILNQTDKKAYRAALEQYPERLKMCIEAKGAYFEHLIK
jgi:histone-lysine N-methyltransferase SETMAR